MREKGGSFGFDSLLMSGSFVHNENDSSNVTLALRFIATLLFLMADTQTFRLLLKASKLEFDVTVAIFSPSDF